MLHVVPLNHSVFLGVFKVAAVIPLPPSTDSRRTCGQGASMPGGNRACRWGDSGYRVIYLSSLWLVYGRQLTVTTPEMLVGANSSTHPSKQTVMAKVKPQASHKGHTGACPIYLSQWSRWRRKFFKWPGLLGQGHWGDGNVDGKQQYKGARWLPHPDSSFPPWQVQCCAPPLSRLGTGDQSGLEAPVWLFRDAISETREAQSGVPVRKGTQSQIPQPSPTDGLKERVIWARPGTSSRDRSGKSTQESFTRHQMSCISTIPRRWWDSSW